MARWSGVILLCVSILMGLGSVSYPMIVNADVACSTNPIPAVTQMLDLASQDHFLEYLQVITGDTPVMISGQLRSIDTRYTPRLFDGSENAMAFQYVEEQLADMQYPPTSSVGYFGYLEHSYTYNGNVWKNLILTIPGQDPVDQRELILSAHLDDQPADNAPGAEDNGVGVAALLELARVIRYFQFDATLKLIWFTGEEQGLRGSRAYLSDYGAFSEDLIGVINLDMFGYDSNGDNCFEIHAGVLPDSFVLGDCLVNVISAYSLPLTYDYIRAVIPAAASDHRPFWESGFGAVEVLEDHFSMSAADPYHQCSNDSDPNPFYHTVDDTITNSIDVPLAFNLVKASLAAAATLSEPQGACFIAQPELVLQSSVPSIILNWQDMGEWITYRLYRSTSGCAGPWAELADNLYETEYYDTPIPVPDLAYRLEAISPSGMCFSLPSNCVAGIAINWLYFPYAAK